MFESLFAERGLSLERLKVLVEVQEAGSIAKAAPGDRVRHSQYSRQLREVSEFFGCEVAQRRGKLLKLTANGVRLADMVREFLGRLDDFRCESRVEKTGFSLGAGDSLVQWLIIPQLGNVLEKLKQVRFGTVSLRTQEIVSQIANSRLDFGLIRKNALISGMKSAPLGKLSYVAVVPERLQSAKKRASFANLFTDYPLAMQTTDGQFTNQLCEIALAHNSAFRPSLACQSFPQVFAAVKSGRFAAVIPEIAVHELDPCSVQIIHAEPLRQLQREIVLMWNPRVIKVRPGAADILAHLRSLLCFT